MGLQRGVYHDKLMRTRVDAEDTKENQDFFKLFKETLKARFQQIDIWITAYAIEVL